jgi:hypothetical protein
MIAAPVCLPSTIANLPANLRPTIVATPFLAVARPLLIIIAHLLQILAHLLLTFTALLLLTIIANRLPILNQLLAHLLLLAYLLLLAHQIFAIDQPTKPVMRVIRHVLLMVGRLPLHLE